VTNRRVNTHKQDNDYILQEFVISRTDTVNEQFEIHTYTHTTLTMSKCLCVKMCNKKITRGKKNADDDRFIFTIRRKVHYECEQHPTTYDHAWPIMLRAHYCTNRD